MRIAFAVTCCLLLGACWQAAEPVITAGERVPGFEDGTYRRPDGSEVAVRWTGEAYAVGTGTARAEPLPGGKWLVDYSDAVRLILVVVPTADGLLVRMPIPDAGTRVAKPHGVTLRPAPVVVISGPANEIRAFAAAVTELDGTPDLIDGEMLVRVR